MSDVLDEEGMPIEDFDDDIDARGALFENKKLSFYIVDGAPAMLEEDEEGSCAFRRAMKAIHQQLLKIGCSTQSVPHHMIGVIIANTGISYPEVHPVDRFFELHALDFVSSEGCVAVKEIVDQEDLPDLFSTRFEGHGECDLGDIIYYARRSSRKAAFLYINSKANMTNYQARKHVGDLRAAGGDFNCLFIGEQNADLGVWRALDPAVSCESIEELEASVYQKAFAPRAYSILPFELGPGVTFDVGLYTLASETKRPSPMYFDQETEQRVQSRTVYRKKEATSDAAKEPQTLGVGSSTTVDDEFMEKDDAPMNGNQEKSKDKPFEFRDTDRARSELKKGIELGGERIIFTQEEIAKLKRFKKGLVLLGFRPMNTLRVDRHVEPAKFVYPNEKTCSGSRLLFRTLLDRCAARNQVMVCYVCVATHTRPRLVALQPSKGSSSSCDGFHMVHLPMADDCVDGSALEKDTEVTEEPSASQDKAAKSLVKRLTTTYAPFENPCLQTFYSMLVEYGTGEEKRVVEDTIKPYFSSDVALRRVQPQLAAMTDEFGDLSGAVAKAPRAVPKRNTADQDGGSRKRAKNSDDDGDRNLEQLAKEGKLSKLTVAELRGFAVGEGIALSASVKKKDDIMRAIMTHYGV